MYEAPGTREELISHLDHISDTGALVGIKNSKYKVVLLYTINDSYAELHYEKKYGLILDIRYYTQTRIPEKFFFLPA